MPAGQPRSFKTVKELESGIAKYFKDCEKNTVKITTKEGTAEIPEPLSVSGLADNLGISRDTLHVYSTGEYGKEYSDAIKRAVARIERDKVSKAMLGAYDKTICIFDLKNNHGWKDEKHINEKSKREHSISPEDMAKIEQASENVRELLNRART